MIRRSILLIALVACVTGTLPAFADPSSITDTPAATLLLPYFEVDLGNTNGTTTVFSVNNASATAILAHVTIWSDLAVPVFGFNIYLTGYDAQVIDLKALLYSGVVPRTATDGQDPQDTISPQGNFSQDINFPSCNGQLPYSPLPSNAIEHLRASLTGQPSAFFGGLCSGLNKGDNIARGYVTVDTVNQCTLNVPGTPGYFISGGVGEATNQNVLWGDFYYITFNTNQSAGFPMVHIRADAANPETSVPGEYTFYGRYSAWTAADNRQPLATNFAARYMVNTLYFPDATDVITWRDPKVDQDPFACGSTPSWYPLGQEAVTIFDEQERPYIAPDWPFFPPPPNQMLAPFPAAAGRVTVNSPDFPVPYNRGWMYLNLNATVAAAGSNPPEDPAAAQAFVSIIFNNTGRYSVGNRATQTDSAINALHFAPGGF